MRYSLVASQTLYANYHIDSNEDETQILESKCICCDSFDDAVNIAKSFAIQYVIDCNTMSELKTIKTDRNNDNYVIEFGFEGLKYSVSVSPLVEIAFINFEDSDIIKDFIGKIPDNETINARDFADNLEKAIDEKY